MAPRSAEPWPRRWCCSALLLGAALTACSDGGDTASRLPPPPRQQPVPPASSSLQQPSPLAPAPGLTPLASPRQLLAAFPIGRPDPYAPLQATAAAADTAPSRSNLSAELRLLGLISGGNSAQAVVQIGDRSATLCPGLRGRCPGAAADQPLLPPGWSVERIEAAQGLLVLRQGRQRQVLSLPRGV